MNGEMLWYVIEGILVALAVIVVSVPIVKGVIKLVGSRRERKHHAEQSPDGTTGRGDP